jgi:hypothetical protein
MPLPAAALTAQDGDPPADIASERRGKFLDHAVDALLVDVPDVRQDLVVDRPAGAARRPRGRSTCSSRRRCGTTRTAPG